MNFGISYIYIKLHNYSRVEFEIAISQNLSISMLILGMAFSVCSADSVLVTGVWGLFMGYS